MKSTESLLTDNDEADDDSCSLCYDADAEEEGDSQPGGPAFRSPDGKSRENQSFWRRQQPSSLCLSELGTTWRWWGMNCESPPRLHLGIDTTFTSLVSSSKYDGAQERKKRPTTNGKPNKSKKKKKARVAPPPNPEFIGFVSDLSELLLATYREAQSMDVEGPSHKDSPSKGDNEDTQKLPEKAESLYRAKPGTSANVEPANSDGLAFLLSSLSTSGSMVLAPNIRTLDDVLMSFSNVPRVIVEAEAPFRTVHTNAAYQRLARDASVDVPLPPSNMSSDGKLEATPFESSTVVYAIQPDPKQGVSHYLVEVLPNGNIQVVG